MQTLTPGSFLQHGAYRIEAVLGQGGFGITYLATDVNLQRKVAIKEFFPKDYCEREDATSHVTLGTRNTAEFVNRLMAKFLKEARNIAKLNHPGIIRIFAAFEENNTAYYVMEYIEGESLSAMVKRGGPLSFSRAMCCVEEAGKALEYVHGLKINHLDIKPANIMVRRSDDTPILIDFGLSKQYDSDGNQTSTTPTGISHGYAPLEQYNDGGVKEFSPQTDIYSLAATLYYLLSGVTPPQATRLNDEELTFPASIPTRMIGPISKAMSPGRRNRHPAVREFIGDLKNGGMGNPEENDATELGSSGSEGSGTKGEFGGSVKPDHKSSRTGLFVIAGVAVLAIVCVVLWLTMGKPGTEKANDSTMTVEDMEWVSPLGGCLYTGELMNDTLASGEIRMIPHGKGVAKINKGNLSGATYDGDFVSGEMEGHSTYTLSNGDVFTGTFHRNQFEEGKYLDKESGEYFEGMFRDMQPYKGKWYSASGQLLEEMSNVANDPTELWHKGKVGVVKSPSTTANNQETNNAVLQTVNPADTFKIKTWEDEFK